MKLTEIEKIILANTDEKYKYIARDKDGDLMLYQSKPDKRFDDWFCCDWERIEIFNHLFQDIKWEDKEPYKFR